MASMSKARAETEVDIRILNYSRRYPTNVVFSQNVFSQTHVIATIRQFVECESPSDNPAAINRFVDLFAETAKDIARVKTYPGKHLRCEFLLPGSRKSGQILALGHSDTVWPIGTLRSMPF